MDKLQVTVEQTPGVITWNFEELKQELAEQLEVYKTIVYTDENIGDAKKDVAALRKLSSAVNSRKIEIKNRCLEPYMVIEQQANELITLINEPISLIDRKVKDYETRRRAEKRQKISRYMDQTFADLPGDIREKLKAKIYDTRWENATASDKQYKDAIAAAHNDTVNALNVIQGIDEDFREAVMAVYKAELNLSSAMAKAQELQKQKELVLERERMRREREMRERQMEEERKRQAEQARQEEAKRQEEQASQVAQNTQDPPTGEDVQSVSRPDNTVVDPQVDSKASPAEESTGIGNAVIYFRGTKEQLSKVVAYIRFVGAEYQLKR